MTNWQLTIDDNLSNIIIIINIYDWIRLQIIFLLLLLYNCKNIGREKKANLDCGTDSSDEK